MREAYFYAMFFILSKVLLFLILPFSWVVILFVWSLFARNPLMKKRLRRVGFAVLILFSNPYLSNLALSALEKEPVSLTRSYDVGIVLSGMVEAGFTAPNQDQLNENFDRLVEAVKLYKDGTIKRILISGGAADILFPDYNEGMALVKLTKIMGVPKQDIVWEDTSKNTYENAVYTAELLNGHSHDLLLITSAFHMRRARACFEKAGLSVTEYPVDYKGRTEFRWKYLLPGSDAFQNWNIVLKEIVGMVMYRLVGYI